MGCGQSTQAPTASAPAPVSSPANDLTEHAGNQAGPAIAVAAATAPPAAPPAIPPAAPPASPPASPGPKPLVVCGPSGVGKGTIIAELMKMYPDHFGFSVSHTTRGPRPGEEDGTHYHFTTREVMEPMVADGKFLEHADVHGNMYGTSIAAVETVASQGKVCILDIDVQGAKKVRASPLAAHFVFVHPPSMEELEKRLRGRGTETEDKIKMRLGNAQGELDASREPGLFDDNIVNLDARSAAVGLSGIVRDCCGLKDLPEAPAAPPPATAGPTPPEGAAPGTPEWGTYLAGLGAGGVATTLAGLSSEDLDKTVTSSGLEGMDFDHVAGGFDEALLGKLGEAEYAKVVPRLPTSTVYGLPEAAFSKALPHLSKPQLSRAAPKLTAGDLDGMGGEQFKIVLPKLGPEQIGAMSPESPNLLPNIPAMATAQVKGLSAAQLSAVLPQLSAEDKEATVKQMSKKQLKEAGIEAPAKDTAAAAEEAAAPAAEEAAAPPPATAGPTPPEGAAPGTPEWGTYLAGLGAGGVATTLAGLSSEDLDKTVTSSGLEGMDFDHVAGGFDEALLGKLGEAEYAKVVPRLPTSTVYGLPEAAFSKALPHLSKPQLSRAAPKLTAGDLDGMGGEQFKIVLPKLGPKQIGAMSPESPNLLPNIPAMATAQVKGLSAAQLSAVLPQLSAEDKEATVKQMSKKQLKEAGIEAPAKDTAAAAEEAAAPAAEEAAAPAAEEAAAPAAEEAAAPAAEEAPADAPAAADG